MLSSFLLVCAVVSRGIAFEHPQAEIMHYWVSPGEQAALNVIKKRFEEAGGEWIETPLANLTSMRSEVIDRIAEGLPPTLMLWHAGNSIMELAELGLVADLESTAQSQHWRSILPQVVLDSVTHNDRFIVVPMNAHGENWGWYNSAIYRELELDYPDSWDELLAQAPIIAAAGYIPLAVGTGDWQVRMLFNDILIGVGGRSAYLNLLSKLQSGDAELDPAVLLRTMQILGALRQYAAPGADSTSWDGATRLVINGQAAVQFMGDWAKGEFQSAGKKLGQDFDCQLAPGNASAYMIVIDAFAFAKTTDPEQQAAQRLIAESLLTPEIQRDFNLAKGSTPLNRDVELDGFDKCSKIGIAALNDNDNLLLSISLIESGYRTNVLTSSLLDFWLDTTIPPEQAAEHLVAALNEQNDN
ncbi:MAG: ABC transporter substrate-binding protein [Gammaproteobacteria bacterium]